MTDRPAFTSSLRELGPNGVLIADIGARYGAADAWFRLKPLARLIGFEPDPVECARLNSSAIAGETFYPLALGATDGPGTLYVAVNPGCSSLYPPSQHAIDCHPGLRDYTTLAGQTAIQLTRLDSWSKREKEPRLDFLKLDAQGAELDILTGAGDLLDTCVGVEAEVAFSAMYDGQPLFADVDQYLRSRGFTFWRFDSLAHYSDQPGEPFGSAKGEAHYDSVTSYWAAGSGRLVWANAVYFRERRTLADRRSLLILATLLEALGDPDGSRHALADATPLVPRPGRLAERLAAMPEVPPRERKRVAITCGCADARDIPKVPNAGRVEGDVQVMHNGVKVVSGGYHGAWMRAIIEQLDGHHEPQDEKAFHAILPTIRPGGVMIELGAFWAYYSLWFAHAVPGSRLILVEPDPTNLEVGKRNLELNGRAAEWVQASVGPASRPPKPFACESDGQERMLPEVCVDDLMERFGVGRCEVLLSDIQGAEVAMLDGAAKSIAAGRVRWVVISTHHASISRDPATHANCLAFVRERGGHVVAELTPEESFSGDGLIVASFDAADRRVPRVELSRNGSRGSLFV